MAKRRIYTKDLLLYKIPTVFADLVLLVIAFLIVVSYEKHLTITEKLEYKELGTLILLVLSYFIAIKIIPIKLAERKISYFTVVLRAIGQSSISVLLFSFFIWTFYRLNPVAVSLYQFILSLGLLTTSHILVRMIIRSIRKSGHNRLNILMVGADMNLIHIYNSMMRGYGVHGYNIMGFFTEKYADQIPHGEKNLGSFDGVRDYIEKHQVDELFCAINPAANTELVYSIIKCCNDNFVQFWFVPNMNGYPHHRMRYDELDRVGIISLMKEPLANPLNRVLKRSFDILCSGLFLITIYPFVWLFAAIGIKLSSPGPILFRQKRTGYSGDEFDCLKFRSMRVNADADKLQATADDPRKTKFGDFMRRTSIDELPQFINVFKGDMSLVGPRPHMDFHTELYSKLISDYMVRHLVKPGITGWAQVNGCRGETKTVEQMKERVEHDIWYIEHWTFWLDIKIMFLTVAQIFKGDKQAY